MTKGTNSVGPELLLALDRGSRRPMRSQLEDGLREAIRTGRLPAGARLPATRVLATDLGVSRRLVVDAYAQLLAEGYLVARRGSGTYVADTSGAAAEPALESASNVPSFDFFPGYPDLAAFPRGAWLRATREALRTAPDRMLGYPDPRGAPELRAAIAAHARRVRGVAADPRSIVVCSGAAQGFALLARALGGPRMAVENPGLPPHRAILQANGASLVALGVDEDGACVHELASLDEAGGSIDAVLVTPAHQSPTGVALSPARRSELLAWAVERDGLIVEDDYDAEYRYDRPPLAAMQGLAPDRVIYMGTVSKTLAPAIRLGWLVLPARLVDAVVGAKALSDAGCPTLDQLALAEMLGSGAYDRHVRKARRRYRARRDALVRAVERHLPGARVTGLAAGLHALVRLERPIDGLALFEAARRRSVGAYPLGLRLHAGPPTARRSDAGLRQPRRARHRRGGPAVVSGARGTGVAAQTLVGTGARDGATDGARWDTCSANRGGAISR